MSRPEDELIPELPAEEPAQPIPVEPLPVEKPEGFDMRERLASDWKPKDAVYQASVDIAESADALFVCWMEDGVIRFHSSGDVAKVPGLIVAALGQFMGWR